MLLGLGSIELAPCHLIAKKNVPDLKTGSGFFSQNLCKRMSTAHILPPSCFRKGRRGYSHTGLQDSPAPIVLPLHCIPQLVWDCAPVGWPIFQGPDQCVRAWLRCQLLSSVHQHLAMGHPDQWLLHWGRTAFHTLVGYVRTRPQGSACMCVRCVRARVGLQAHACVYCLFACTPLGCVFTRVGPCCAVCVCVCVVCVQACACVLCSSAW